MSLRDPSHQSAIELGLMDTEYVAGLKRERELLREERSQIPIRNAPLGLRKRYDVINQRLARIEELLKK